MVCKFLYKPCTPQTNLNCTGNTFHRSWAFDTALDCLAEINIQLVTPIEYARTIDDLVTTLASELFRPPTKSTFSAFGLLCSASVKEQAPGIIDSTLLQLARSFVFVCIFLHRFPPAHDMRVPMPDFKGLLLYMLQRLVKHLDRLFKPRQLAACSVGQLKCLFLILIGMSEAVMHRDVC